MKTIWGVPQKVAIIPKATKAEVDLKAWSLTNTIRVSTSDGNIQSIADLQSYLDELETNGQTAGIRIVIDGGRWNVADTLTIDYTYPVSIEGSGISSTILQAATGLTNKPMIEISSRCDIKAIGIDGSTLASWGTQATEIVIAIKNNVYCEITDFYADTGYTGIKITDAGELFMYNFVVSAMTSCGVDFDSPTAGGSIDVEIGNFADCANAVSLTQGDGVDVFVDTVRFLNESGQTAILYVPANFVNYDTFTVSGCEWNRVGTFRSGFDFTLTRDANIEFMNNVGDENKSPHAKINVTNNTTATSISTSGTYVVASYTNDANAYKCKWTLADNKMTYQSDHEADVVMNIAGSIEANFQPATISIAILKNGTGSPISPMTVYAKSSGEPVAFAMVAYLDDVSAGDYYQIIVTANGNSKTVTVKYLNWYASAR